MTGFETRLTIRWSVVQDRYRTGTEHTGRDERDERRTAARTVGERVARLALSSVSTRAAKHPSLQMHMRTVRLRRELRGCIPPGSAGSDAEQW